VDIDAKMSHGWPPPHGSAFGYGMNQGRAGWQHKHVRQLIDLVYAGLDQR
jgi:hypothetical protein